MSLIVGNSKSSNIINFVEFTEREYWYFVV
jgi:hypothetical protein